MSRMTLRVGRAHLTRPGGRIEIRWLNERREVTTTLPPGATWSMRYPRCTCGHPQCPDARPQPAGGP